MQRRKQKCALTCVFEAVVDSGRTFSLGRRKARFPAIGHGSHSSSC